DWSSDVCSSDLNRTGCGADSQQASAARSEPARSTISTSWPGTRRCSSITSTGGPHDYQHSDSRGPFHPFGGQSPAVGGAGLAAGAGGDHALDRAGGRGVLADGIDCGDVGGAAARCAVSAAYRLGQSAALPPCAGGSPDAAPAPTVVRSVRG